MCGVITASEPTWIAPFTGLSPRSFGKLVTALRREGADPVRKGRPWSFPLEDRVLLVASYWRTNLTMRQLAPLFGISKSAADRIINGLGPSLALRPRQRFRKDTVQDTMPLHVRTWTCDCGTTHDRDVNAAKNPLAAGQAVAACGAGVRPQRSTPGGQSAMKQEVSRREP